MQNALNPESGFSPELSAGLETVRKGGGAVVSKLSITQVLAQLNLYDSAVARQRPSLGAPLIDKIMWIVKTQAIKTGNLKDGYVPLNEGLNRKNGVEFRDSQVFNKFKAGAYVLGVSDILAFALTWMTQSVWAGIAFICFAGASAVIGYGMVSNWKEWDRLAHWGEGEAARRAVSEKI
jgi:hypothetical protein